MSLSDIPVIVGLGNPGKNFVNTRHNAGFRIIDQLSKEHAIPLNQTYKTVEFGKGQISQVTCMLVKPMNYMNLSGPSLQQFVFFYKTHIENMVVIHDDMDITLGKIKIKQKGGHGGHNGVKSIIETFGNNQFIRIRIGIGRPEKQNPVDYVLQPFTNEENELVDMMISTTCKAIQTILLKGVTYCMNHFNNKQIMV